MDKVELKNGDDLYEMFGLTGKPPPQSDELDTQKTDKINEIFKELTGTDCTSISKYNEEFELSKLSTLLDTKRVWRTILGKGLDAKDILWFKTSMKGRDCLTQKYEKKPEMDFGLRKIQREDLDDLFGDPVCDLIRAFHSADVDKGGNLDYQEFMDMMIEKDPNITDMEIFDTFCKIDADMSNTIELSEFFDYHAHMSELTSRIEEMKKERIYEEASVEVKIKNPYTSQFILFTDRKRQKSSDPLLFFALDKLGHVFNWNHLSGQKKNYILKANGDKKFSPGGINVRLAKYLKSEQMLVVFTNRDDLLFYDMKKDNFALQTAHIEGIRLVVAFDCRSFSSDKASKNTTLYFMHSNGEITEIGRRSNRQGFFDQGHEPKKVYLLSSLIRGDYKDIYVKIHCSFMCNGISDFMWLQDDTVACCANIPSQEARPLSPTLMTFETNTSKVSYGNTFCHLTCLQISKKTNKLLCGRSTGEIDVYRLSSVTSPFVILSFIENNSVEKMTVDEENQILFALHSNHYVYLWSLVSNKLLQTIANEHIILSGFGEVTIFKFDPLLKNVFIGSKYLCYLPRSKQTVRQSAKRTHSAGVRNLFYDSNFQILLTIDAKSETKMWSTNNGKLAYSRKQLTSSLDDFEFWDESITAITIDDTGRRILTVSTCNLVTIWNLHSGKLLSQSELDWDLSEIALALHFRKMKVFIAGTTRQVHVFLCELTGLHNFTDFEVIHESPINHLASSDKYLTSASCDGIVIVWFADVAMPLLKINTYGSIKTTIVPSLKKRRLQVEFIGSRKDKMMKTPLLDERKRQLRLVLEADPHRFEETVKRNMKPIVKKDNNEELDIYALKCLLFLKSRVNQENQERIMEYTANFVTVGMFGWIFFWSVEGGGELCSLFNSASDIGHHVEALCTSENDKLLYAGDSSGRVYVWYIESYAVEETGIRQSRRSTHRSGKYGLPMDYNRILNDDDKIENYRERIELNRRKKFDLLSIDQVANQTKKKINYPPLLFQFRAHSTRISSIVFDIKNHSLITASDDGYVHIFRQSGVFVGTLMNDRRLRLDVRSPSINKLADYHRSFSANTLDILLDGVSGDWIDTLKVLLALYCLPVLNRLFDKNAAAPVMGVGELDVLEEQVERTESERSQKSEKKPLAKSERLELLRAITFEIGNELEDLGPVFRRFKDIESYDNIQDSESEEEDGVLEEVHSNSCTDRSFVSFARGTMESKIIEEVKPLKECSVENLKETVDRIENMVLERPVVSGSSNMIIEPETQFKSPLVRKFIDELTINPGCSLRDFYMQQLREGNQTVKRKTMGEKPKIERIVHDLQEDIKDVHHDIFQEVSGELNSNECELEDMLCLISQENGFTHQYEFAMRYAMNLDIENIFDRYNEQEQWKDTLRPSADKKL